MRTITAFIARARRIWAELDYAQRRLLEIRTGVPMTARASHEARPQPV